MLWESRASDLQDVREVSVCFQDDIHQMTGRHQAMALGSSLETLDETVGRGLRNEIFLTIDDLAFCSDGSSALPEELGVGPEPAGLVESTECGDRS